MMMSHGQLGPKFDFGHFGPPSLAPRRASQGKKQPQLVRKSRGCLVKLEASANFLCQYHLSLMTLWNRARWVVTRGGLHNERGGLQGPGRSPVQNSGGGGWATTGGVSSSRVPNRRNGLKALV